MIRLDGRSAVVIGGASGIGAATVRGMAQLGARVLIADVDVLRSERLVEELTASGFEVKFCRTDVLEEAQIENAMATAVEAFGGLDIVHNSAGIPRTIAPDAEVANMTLERWNKTVAGHLTSTMLSCKHALPRLIARGGGAIVNTSSLSAVAATVDLIAYSAAKAGVHALTREVAATYGRDNVRCNAVVPGAVLTARGRATLPKDIFELFATETVLPRLTEPEDIANAVIFLASDAARMITGQTLQVDGGMTTKLPYWLPKMRGRLGARFDESTSKYTDE